MCAQVPLKTSQSGPRMAPTCPRISPVFAKVDPKSPQYTCNVATTAQNTHPIVKHTTFISYPWPGKQKLWMCKNMHESTTCLRTSKSKIWTTYKWHEICKIYELSCCIGKFNIKLNWRNICKDGNLILVECVGWGGQRTWKHLMKYLYHDPISIFKLSIVQKVTYNLKSEMSTYVKLLLLVMLCDIRRT